MIPFSGWPTWVVWLLVLGLSASAVAEEDRTTKTLTVSGDRGARLVKLLDTLYGAELDEDRVKRNVRF